MKVYDLEGREYTFKLKGRKTGPRSKLCLRVRQLLTELYPTVQTVEEIPIELNRRTTLYLDFYIPLIATAIEVQGQQHSQFVQHFHGTRMGFIAQKRNDADKKRWCDLNNIRLVYLNYDETDEQWKDIINDPED